jgi:DNA-binding transcriptional MerR regulator
MALGEAKAKAKIEFKKYLDETGFTLEEIKAYVDSHEELQKPFYRVGHRKGVIGVAANFILDVAGKMRKDGIKPVAASANHENA